jgi:hypothetical protein
MAAIKTRRMGYAGECTMMTFVKFLAFVAVFTVALAFLVMIGSAIGEFLIAQYLSDLSQNAAAR